MADPMDELRKKLIRELEAAQAAEKRQKPTPRQKRFWEWLRWLYNTPTQRQEREGVPPIGPADHEWLERALMRLDDLDKPDDM